MLILTPFKEEVGKDFDQGLTDLKKVVEKRPSPEEEKNEGEKESDKKDGEAKDGGRLKATREEHNRLLKNL